MGLLDFFPEDEKAVKPVNSDKRLTPRWKISVPAKIKLEGNNGYSPCEIKDLNLKGFSLLIEKKILKKRIGARLYFNEKYDFKIEVIILWSKMMGSKHLYGMKFNKIFDSDRALILQMMNENFPPHVWKGV